MLQLGLVWHADDLDHPFSHCRHVTRGILA